MSADGASAPGAGAATRAFAVPRGLLGRIGAGVMAHANEPQQREIVTLVHVARDAQVIEVGYGPGELIRLLTAVVPDGLVAGVDIADVMFQRAARVNRRAIQEGRVDLRVGDAAALPFPDASFDVAITVNSLLIWPDPDAGTRELRRVLRPAGTAYVAWHGAQSPQWLQRRLALAPDRLAALTHILVGVFPQVERKDLRHSTVLVCRSGP